MQTTCPNCGTVNRVGARFCSKCGTALASQPATPTPPPIETPPPAPKIPPARPAARGNPNRLAIIVLALVLCACVGLMVAGGGAYYYFQAIAATPTPSTNIKTVVAPIQSQIPALQTRLPELQTALPIPSSIATLLPNVPGLPNLFATATPQP